MKLEETLYNTNFDFGTSSLFVLPTIILPVYRINNCLTDFILTVSDSEVINILLKLEISAHYFQVHRSLQNSFIWYLDYFFSRGPCDMVSQAFIKDNLQSNQETTYNCMNINWTYFLLSVKFFESWSLIMKCSIYSGPTYLNLLLSLLSISSDCPCYVTFSTEIQKSSVNPLSCLESILRTCWREGPCFIFTVCSLITYEVLIK